MLRDSEFGALDIDDCRDASTGEINLWARDLIAKAESYTEITPSGTGLRIIGRAKGPHLHRKQPAPNGISLETFRKATRFITVTGNVLPDTEAKLADLDVLMDAIVAELDGNVEQIAGPEDPRDENTPPEDIAPDDPRLAKLAQKWIALGHDGEGMENYTSYDEKGCSRTHRSRAVMAFVCECFRAGIDASVVRMCLMHWKIGEHIREQKDVVRAINRAIRRAHEFVTNSKLFEMNEKHCVLPIGDKTRVITWGEDPDFPGRKTIIRHTSLGEFKALQDKHRHSYMGRDQEGNPIRKTIGLGTWWVRQPHRRQYDGGMRFMPSCDDNEVGDTLNL